MKSTVFLFFLQIEEPLSDQRLTSHSLSGNNGVARGVLELADIAEKHCGCLMLFLSSKRDIAAEFL